METLTGVEAIVKKSNIIKENEIYVTSSFKLKFFLSIIS
jgi:hypothetical protein